MKVEIVKGVKAGSKNFPDEIAGIKMTPETEEDELTLGILYRDSWGCSTEECIAYEIEEISKSKVENPSSQRESLFLRRQLL